MYPLVIIFGVGLWQEDRGAARYAMPFIVMGTLIAAYHNLLYYGFISETLAPCKLGVSCTAKQISIAGFISIPLLSLGGFLALAAFTLIFQRSQKDSHV